LTGGLPPPRLLRARLGGGGASLASGPSLESTSAESSSSELRCLRRLPPFEAAGRAGADGAAGRAGAEEAAGRAGADGAAGASLVPLELLLPPRPPLPEAPAVPGIFVANTRSSRPTTMKRRPDGSLA